MNEEHKHTGKFVLREHGESITGLGTVWIVDEHFGDCDCGAVHEMKSIAGYFPDQLYAKVFVIFGNFYRKVSPNSFQDHINKLIQ